MPVDTLAALDREECATLNAFAQRWLLHAKPRYQLGQLYQRFARLQ